jgi:hypothetical protein
MLCAVIELGLHGEAGHRVDATDVAVPLRQQGNEAASGERAPHPLTGTGGNFQYYLPRPVVHALRLANSGIA